MTDERQEMVLKNQRLVNLVLKKMNYKYDLEEIRDIGMVGLCKGAKTFDFKKGFKESTYLTRCIQNEILIYFRKKENRDFKISLNEIFELENSNPIEFLSIIPDQKVDLEKDILKQELITELYKYLSDLNNKEKFIIYSLYGIGDYEEITQQQIAQKLNISQAQVSKLKVSAIRKLRKRLINEY